MPLTIIELVDQEEEEFHCPFCGHRLYPPDLESPYCKHTVFVYLESSIDDDGFIFITPSFAGLYLEKLKLTKWWYDDEYDELTDEDLEDFRNGKLDRQNISLLDIDLLDEGIFPQDKKVICYIFKSGGYYPGAAYYCLEEL